MRVHLWRPPTGARFRQAHPPGFRPRLHFHRRHGDARGYLEKMLLFSKLIPQTTRPGPHTKAPRHQQKLDACHFQSKSLQASETHKTQLGQMHPKPTSHNAHLVQLDAVAIQQHVSRRNAERTSSMSSGRSGTLCTVGHSNEEIGLADHLHERRGSMMPW